jgi:hypothetical protein
MPRPMSGRILSYALSGILIAAAIFVTVLTISHRAEARVFIGFGFGFPGFVGPPIYAPPPLVLYRPPVVYAPPPVVPPPAPVVYVPPPPPVKHYRRPVRHHRPCRCYGS